MSILLLSYCRYTLHPQTNLATCSTTNDPVHASVEDGYSRHSSDTLSVELGELVSGGTVDIDKAVHVSDAESLDVRLWVQLPLGA